MSKTSDQQPLMGKPSKTKLNSDIVHGQPVQQQMMNQPQPGLLQQQTLNEPGLLIPQQPNIVVESTDHGCLTATHPFLKCGVQDCNNISFTRCRWSMTGCCKTFQGGCGKKLC